MNTVLTNTAALNGGDAAILFATLEILRKALGNDVHVTVCDQQSDVSARFYPDLDIKPTLFVALEQCASSPWRRKIAFLHILAAARLWRTSTGRALMRALPPSAREATERITGADLVVSAGGTYLVPHYRFLPRLADLLVAHAAGRPYILFTQSLGPFPKRGRAWRVARFALRRARVVIVRDAQSRRHLEALGVRRERIVECADAAFAFPLAPETPPLPRHAGNNRPMRVAISVRDWPHFGGRGGMAQYLGAVAALTERIVTEYRAEVTFVSTCQGAPEYWTDDSTVAEALVSTLGEEIRRQVRIDRDFHSPLHLVSMLRTYDAVVATRMHVAILALVAGVPVLPIAYEFKTAELFAKIGLGGLVQDIETMTPHSLCGAFDHFHTVRNNLAAMLPGIVGKQRRDALSAGEYLKEAIAVAP